MLGVHKTSKRTVSPPLLLALYVMKNILILILSFLLLLSIAGGLFVAQDLFLSESKYEYIEWNEGDYEIINKAYAKSGEANKTPVGYFPYKVESHSDGYTIRFKDNSHLTLRKSVLLDEDIVDGCAWIHLDKDFNLESVFYCG